MHKIIHRCLHLAVIVLIFTPVIQAEVLVIDGEDHLLLPADLVAGDDFGSRNLYWSSPYEINDDGHLFVTDVYKRIYKFDDESIKKINKALLQLEHDYFKHLHDNGKIEKLINGTLIFTIKNSQEGMAKAMETYKKTLNEILTEKQKPILKYFNILEFKGRSSNSKVIITDNEEVTVTLTLPKDKQPFELKQPDKDEEIAALKKKLEAAEVEMRAGGGNHQEFMKLRRQLSKLDVNMNGNDNSYSIQYQYGNHGSSSSSSSDKPGSFLFYERAYRFHVDGSLE